jgi:hypothetical protein
MLNASLLTLPTELHHRIFDYLDVQTVIRSVRCVCRQLHATVNAYNRLQLNLTSMIKPDLKLLRRVIRPENVISITFSDGDRATSGEIDLFFSNVDVHRFTQLRSLTFHQKKTW